MMRGQSESCILNICVQTLQQMEKMERVEFTLRIACWLSINRSFGLEGLFSRCRTGHPEGGRHWVSGVGIDLEYLCYVHCAVPCTRVAGGLESSHNLPQAGVSLRLLSRKLRLFHSSIFLRCLPLLAVSPIERVP